MPPSAYRSVTHVSPLSLTSLLSFTHFRCSLDELNHFMRINRFSSFHRVGRLTSHAALWAIAAMRPLPSLRSLRSLRSSVLQVRLREFFRHTKSFARLHSYDKLFHQMSHQLRGDTALLVGKVSLSRVWYFDLNLVEKEFVGDHARALNTCSTLVHVPWSMYPGPCAAYNPSIRVPCESPRALCAALTTDY